MSLWLQEKQKDGSYTATVTLGSSQREVQTSFAFRFLFEAFQILLDGEPDKVLHPERHPNKKRAAFSTLVGPMQRPEHVYWAPQCATCCMGRT